MEKPDSNLKKKRSKTTSSDFVHSNDLLATIIKNLETLTGWAEADVENSLETGAKNQAKDDNARLKALKKAKHYLLQAYKS